MGGNAGSGVMADPRNFESDWDYYEAELGKGWDEEDEGVDPESAIPGSAHHDNEEQSK